jgi:hypothetical protein
MDPVSKLSRALAIIRRAAARPSGTTRQPAEAKAGSASEQASEAEFRAVVAQRLGAISAQDPDRRNTSARVFLEQVLLREFGAKVLNSQHFQDTLREVQRVMEADAAMSAELDNLIQELTGQK